MTTTIGIVDDHPLIRRGLAAAIGDDVNLQVLWTAADQDEAVQQIESSPAALVVVDLMLGSTNGLDLIRLIKERWPKIRILVSTMHDEGHYAVRCYKAGAHGFVSKSDSVGELVDGIRSVVAGGLKFSPQATAQLLSSHDQPVTEDRCPLVNLLSDRELQVLELMGDGKTTREIADALFLSRKTVDTFRERIKRKLNIDNAAELTHFATKWVMANGQSPALY